MDKYDIARRIKHMVSEEHEINELDTKIRRKSAKCYQHISDLLTSLNKQEIELSTCRKEINYYCYSNTKLEIYIQEQEARLCAIRQKVEQMQIGYQQKLKSQIEERIAASRNSDCIRSLKQSTQTYIKLSALPHKIQGVTLCEKETSTDWKPLCIDPLKNTKKEVQDIIWHDTQLDSVYREKWEKLVLGDLLEDQNVNMKNESSNATIYI